METSIFQRWQASVEWESPPSWGHLDCHFFPVYAFALHQNGVPSIIIKTKTSIFPPHLALWASSIIKSSSCPWQYGSKILSFFRSFSRNLSRASFKLGKRFCKLSKCYLRGFLLVPIRAAWWLSLPQTWPASATTFCFFHFPHIPGENDLCGGRTCYQLKFQTLFLSLGQAKKEDLL